MNKFLRSIILLFAFSTMHCLILAQKSDISKEQKCRKECTHKTPIGSSKIIYTHFSEECFTKCMKK